MRALAREVAFKIIYQSFFKKEDENQIEQFLEQDNITSEDDKSFVVKLVELFKTNKNDVDATIDNLLVDFSLDRIYKIDRAIISLAVVEMKYFKQTPSAIVINEAVKMAKKYGTDKSYSFVNGILKSVLKGITNE